MSEANPKKLMGDKKPPLHLLPLAGMIHQSLAHMDGDLKYGFENWNDKPVEKLTYIGAAMRHLQLYKYGETHTRDTTVHNLGGVMACCAILLDAELNGNLIDNTKHSKATCDLLHNAEIIVEKLKEMQREREQSRKDQSWADAANEPSSKRDDPETAERFERLKQDALARAKGLNIDGSTRRETVMLPIIDDAGGDAPAEPFKLITPSEIEKVLYAPKTPPVEPPKKFTTCGKCDDIKECGSKGRCFGR